MCVEWKAEVPAFARSRFVFIRLVGRHFKRNNKIRTKKPEPRNSKHAKIIKNTYPVKTELSQNNL